MSFFAHKNRRVRACGRPGIPHPTESGRSSGPDMVAMTGKRVLVVDDNAQIGDFVRQVAEAAGCNVTVTANAGDFERLYGETRPDLIILDIVMPQKDGFEIIRHLSKMKSKARLILVSGSSEVYLSMASKIARDLGLTGVTQMRKPLRLAELRRVLSEA
jgi:DNA-binding response OmpR family regulator